MKPTKNFKQLGAYKKRGIIYGLVGVIGICVEMHFRESPRLSVILLWSGLIVIAVLVYFLLKEPES